MNLKICCEANVDLENYSKLENINYEVKDYSISGDSLNGSVDINGVFINTNNEKSNFGKNVPFTVMFHSDVHNKLAACAGGVLCEAKAIKPVGVAACQNVFRAHQQFLDGGGKTAF